MLRRVDARQQRAFALIGRRKRVGTVRDMHPACGPAPAPAADRREGDAGTAACLQQRCAGFGARHPPVGAGDADRRPLPRLESAHRPPDDQRRGDRGGRETFHVPAPFGPLVSRIPYPFQHGADPACVRRQRQHVPAANRDTRERQCRQEQRHRKEERQPAEIPWPETQPEVRPDAAMRRDHGHQRDLLEGIAPDGPQDIKSSSGPGRSAVQAPSCRVHARRAGRESPDRAAAALPPGTAS